MSRLVRLLGGVVFCLGVSGATGWAVPTTKTHHAPAKGVVSHTTGAKAKTTAKSTTARSTASKSTTGKVVARTTVHARGARPTLAVRRTRYREHFTASSFADNLTLGDVIEGEDPTVREAAIEALGNMNGTAVAIDPSNGRILAMVNQKLALSRGAEPCSTIKLTVALAALEEGIVTQRHAGEPGARIPPDSD